MAHHKEPFMTRIGESKLARSVVAASLLISGHTAKPKEVKVKEKASHGVVVQDGHTDDKIPGKQSKPPKVNGRKEATDVGFYETPEVGHNEEHPHWDQQPGANVAAPPKSRWTGVEAGVLTDDPGYKPTSLVDSPSISLGGQGPTEITVFKTKSADKGPELA